MREIIIQKEQTGTINIRILSKEHKENTLGKDAIVLESTTDGNRQKIYIEKSLEALKKAIEIYENIK